MITHGQRCCNGAAMLGTAQNKTIRQAFLFNIPKMPLCADSFQYGLQQQAKRVAITKRNIQINTKECKRWLAVDLDFAGSAYACEDHLLGLSPTIVTVNPANNHSHALFLLKTPVFSKDTKSVQYFNDIKRAYNHVLGGDSAYAGLITKNPFSKQWRNLIPIDTQCFAYDLGELAEALPASVNAICKTVREAKISRSEQAALEDAQTQPEGRNTALFDGLREWAAYNVMHYRDTSQNCWLDALRSKANEINGTFSVCLPASEVKSVVRSVGGHIYPHSPYDAKAEAAFKVRQSSRGKSGGTQSGKVRQAQSENKRVSARLMKAKGLSNASIAKELGVSDRTIRNWFSAEIEGGNEAKYQESTR